MYSDLIAFSQFLQSQFVQKAQPGDTPARVVRVDGAMCSVLTSAHPIERARLPHASQHRGPFPAAVGDWAICRPETRALADLAVIEVLQRNSQFARQAAGRSSRTQVVAANIDAIFILNRPYHPDSPVDLTLKLNDHRAGVVDLQGKRVADRVSLEGFAQRREMVGTGIREGPLVRVGRDRSNSAVLLYRCVQYA